MSEDNHEDESMMHYNPNDGDDVDYYENEDDAIPDESEADDDYGDFPDCFGHGIRNTDCDICPYEFGCGV